jgi:hypothetical protein
LLAISPLFVAISDLSSRPLIGRVGSFFSEWLISLRSSGLRQFGTVLEIRIFRDAYVDYWPLERLIPFARNARTHSPSQVAEIAGSIRAFGFSNPILVGAEGDVIAGHGRLAAARQLGLLEVPVVVLADLSELQRRQLVLADNRIALNAGWDMEMLSRRGEGYISPRRYLEPRTT